MRTRTAAAMAVIFCVLASQSWGAAPPQTKTWRIGVAGSYCNGYWGMLGRSGLPRERLLEHKMTDPEYLSQFDVVIYAIPMTSAADAIEKFVYDGGIAVTEGQIWPSATALPGARITQRKGPNIRFVPSECPASEGLPEMGLIAASRRPACSITPDPSRPDTFILARYTDERANDDVTGVFLDGNQGSPAMILFKYGKGWWLWSGTYMAFWTALSGEQFTTPIMNALKYASGGELDARWDMTELSKDDLLTNPAEPKLSTRRRPGRGELAGPPEAYEVWDDDPAQAGDFDLTGVFTGQGDAEIISSYWNDKWFRAVRFAGNEVSVVRVENGAGTVVDSALLSEDEAAKSRNIYVKRRRGQILVRVDGVPTLACLDGSEQEGVVASKGLEDVVCQPAKPTEFFDEFMRTADEQSDWEVISGAFSVQQDVGDIGKGAVAQSVNPFRYEGKSEGDKQARAIAGSWFWNDYHAEVSVQPRCEQIELLAHYEDAENYLAMRVGVSKERGKSTPVSLIAVEAGQERVLAKGEAQCLADQWCKLALRVSGGYVEGLVDEKIVALGADERRATGGIGLCVSGGEALFDDVLVRPWTAMPRSCDSASATNWLVERGACAVAPETPDTLLVSGERGARILSPWAGNSAYEFWGAVRPSEAGESGLYLRYLGPRSYYALSFNVESDESKVARKVTRVSLKRNARREETVIGTATLSGGATQERRVVGRLTDDRLEIWVDGEKLFDLMDEGPRWGRIGMFSSPGVTAEFRRLGAVPIDREHRLVDELTPVFAGIIDRHSWAGKRSFLIADPDDMELFWHRGSFVSDVTFGAAVRENGGQAKTVASVFLGDGQDPASGYEVRASRVWDQSEIDCEILRKGQVVATGKADVLTTRPGFVTELARTNGTIALRIDGEAAVSFKDPERIDVRQLGVKLSGSKLNEMDTRVETPNARVYTFGRAATDWITEVGTWQVASRWTCSPGWTWFAGWDPKEAWTTNKEVFTGDQQMSVFVGAKMIQFEGANRQETLRDIHLGLCTTPGDIKSGYRFILGGKENTWTAIQKNGETVVEIGWSVPQGGLHNDWTYISAIKHGNVVSLEWEGHEVVRWEDPEPIASGHVALGTFNNGLIIPKVRVFGEVQRPGVPEIDARLCDELAASHSAEGARASR